MEIRDFMTKENLEMIGLAVMCDRYAQYGYDYDGRTSIFVNKEKPESASFDNFEKLIRLGEDITVIMEFFETLNGECKIKDVSEYLKEKKYLNLSMQRITAVCRRLCASGFLKQRYSDPYKVTIKTCVCDWGKYPLLKEVTKEIEVKDSLYSLA